MSKEMKLDKVSSEEIVSMFEDAFEEQVASINKIGAFGIECDDRQIDQPIQVKVDISGHAGTPTIDQFREGEVENSKEITLSRPDIGEMKFKLVPSLTCFLSGNDYLLVYQSAN